MSARLPAEWEKQDGILLPWPHSATDWANVLPHVEPVFVEIARETSRFEQVVIIAPDTAAISAKLAAAGTLMENVRFYDIKTDDTWARDYGPVSIYKNERAIPLDFCFNGWGNKFNSEHDNRTTALLGAMNLFSSSPRTINMVFEGGSIDTDGKGNLLTTSRCLLNLNRNPDMTQQDIVRTLEEELGIENILWLESGMLMGDDTDSHIDILARFAPNDTILYTHCTDRNDPHFAELDAMHKQLESFRTSAGLPFNLLPLPLPVACYDAAGNRLAATYANFLTINDAVLVPTYNDSLDEDACAVIAEAFPAREVVRIDSLPLIQQGGSLHCSTMQFPEGVLA